MNKVNFLIGLIFSLILISCGSDDNLVRYAEEDLVGTWELIEYTIAETNELELDGDINACEYTIIGSDLNYDLIIRSDPKIITASGTFLITSSLSCEGIDDLSEEDFVNSQENDPRGIHVGDWELDGRNLINSYTEFDGGPVTRVVSEIKELTADRLVLILTKENEDETLVNLPIDGLNVTIKGYTSSIIYQRKQ